MAYDDEKELDEQMSSETDAVDSILSEISSLKEENNDEEVPADTVETKSDGYVSQFGELEEFTEDTESEVVGETAKTRKKMSTKKAVTILVLCVVLLMGIGIGAYFVFFDHSIYGKWLITQTYDDGTKADTYYIFRKYAIEISAFDGHSYQKNVYNDVSYEKDTFSILQDGKVYMRCSYSVKGNLIQGKTLTYSMEGYENLPSVELNNTSAVVTEDALETSEFKGDKTIIGIWENNESVACMDYLLFDDKGKMTQLIADNSVIRKTVKNYDFDGKQISLKDGQGEVKFDVECKGDNLSITMDSLYTGQIIHKYHKISQEKFDQDTTKLNEGKYELPTASELPSEIVEPTAQPKETSTEQTS